MMFMFTQKRKIRRWIFARAIKKLFVISRFAQIFPNEWWTICFICCSHLGFQKLTILWMKNARVCIIHMFSNDDDVQVIFFCWSEFQFAVFFSSFLFLPFYVYWHKCNIFVVVVVYVFIILSFTQQAKTFCLFVCSTMCLHHLEMKKTKKKK